MHQMHNTVFIAEDEPLAREALVSMFADRGNWQVIGTAENGVMARDACLQDAPDVLVTDIRMPLLNGLELASLLRTWHSATQVVFITAYDQHAVEAFRLAAVDYLLKPVTDGDFRACIERIEESLRRQRTMRRLDETGIPLDRLLGQPRDHPPHLIIRSLGRVDIVPLLDVVELRADRNYVNVITPKRSWLHRETMKSLSQRLDPMRFIQVHRSIIVAIDRVCRVERSHSGVSLLTDMGTRCPVAARFLPDVERVLGIV